MSEPIDNVALLGNQVPILVTGAAGTVGHLLCLRLAAQGLRVRAVDAGVVGVGYRAFHRELLAGKVEWVDGNLCDPAVAARAVAGVAVIHHLAGNGSHAGAMADPLADLEQNLRATETLLEAARQAGHRPRFVLGSTRQLYGRATSLPVTEEEPVKIVDVNAVHKQAAEEMVRLYHRVHGIPGVILRLTNLFGPGMRIQDSRQVFYGGWMRALLEKRAFEVWGGAQIRDLLHTADAAEAFVRAGVAAAAEGQTYNIASGQGVSLRELADRMVTAWGGGGYEVRELPEAQRRIDIGDFVADISKAARDLNWRPGFTLDGMIHDTLSYYRAIADRYLGDV